MKTIKDIIFEKFGGNNTQTIVLSPEAIKSLLKFIKGKEDRGVCISYEYNDDEWAEIAACFYDERNDKGSENWPWKKIWEKK